MADNKRGAGPDWGNNSSKASSTATAHWRKASEKWMCDSALLRERLGVIRGDSGSPKHPAR